MRSESTRWPVALLLAATCGCAGAPARPDPVVELRRHHEEWWAYLAATYDRDHDRRVTRAEYGRDDAAFARLDRDGDGAVTRADFERDLVLPPDLVIPMLVIEIAAGPDEESVTIARALDAFSALDRNGDGRVDRAEYQSVAREHAPGVDRFGTLLAGVDADRDGLVARPELERWLERRDADHDGRIVRRERIAPGPPPVEGFIERRERERAPDFTATALSGGTPVALDSLVGEKPVALIFGSFT